MIDQSSRRIGVYGLAVVEDAVLLTRVAPGYPGGGRWTLPGGGLERGEAPDEALQREIHEETGLAVAAAEVLDLFSETVTTVTGQTVHSLQLVYGVTLHGTPRRETDGSTDDVAWHPLHLLPATVSLVGRALEARSVQSR
jgi:8-oxo-dGTP pyrophosphatase MutT (NUDIX family)